MRVFFIAMLLSSISHADYMNMPIDEVYDGDTIKTHISTSRLPSPLNKFSIRIRGIDTPELPAKSYADSGKLGRSSCKKEADLALQARDYLIHFIDDKRTMKVYNYTHGKYGGRIVADVIVNGRDVADLLLANNFAVAYDGGKKTKDWCAE